MLHGKQLMGKKHWQNISNVEHVTKIQMKIQQLVLFLWDVTKMLALIVIILLEIFFTCHCRCALSVYTFLALSHFFLKNTGKIKMIKKNVSVWKPSSKTPLTAVAVQNLCNKVLEASNRQGRQVY